MAQPPLSRLVRTIEHELGAALFERSQRHVRLTAVGEALVEPARELVMQSERIPALVRRVRDGEVGTVRLGFAGSSTAALVSALAGKVRRKLPDISLELHGAELSHSGLEKLRGGELDAVVGRWDFLPKDVASTVIASEELVVALPSEHRLAREDIVRLTDLADEPWIVLPGGSSATLSNRLQLLGTRGRFVPRVVRTAVDSATQLLLVDSGAGVALTFSGVRDNIPVHRVVFRALDPDLGAVDVRLAWRTQDTNPALSAVVALVRAPSN